MKIKSLNQSVFIIQKRRWQIIELPHWASRFDDDFCMMEVPDINKVPQKLQSLVNKEIDEEQLWIDLSNVVYEYLQHNDTNSDGHSLVYEQWENLDEVFHSSDAAHWYAENYGYRQSLSEHGYRVREHRLLTVEKE